MSTLPATSELYRELTTAARENALQRCLGRDAYVADLFVRMERPGRRRILIVGQEGTGKQNLVEGATMALLDQSSLETFAVFELNPHALRAGTIRMHELGEQLLNELLGDENFILFVDDLGVVINSDPAGSQIFEGYQNAINEAKISVVATMLPDDFERLSEAKPEVLEGYDVVRLEAMSASATLEVLQALRPTLQMLHGVQISSTAMKYAVKMSVEYLPSHALPGKAINVMTRACGRYVDKAEAKDADPDWIDAASMHFLAQKVSTHDVKRVIGEMTSVDIDEAQASDWRERTLHRLEKYVFGQSESMELAAESAATALAKLGSRSLPPNVLLFVGPHGAGKSHAARVLGQTLTGSEEHLRVYDMAEYQSHDEVKQLLGFAPGIGGNVLNGEIRRAVRDVPLAVLVFEHVEKANPFILAALEQTLETGRLRDEEGNRLRLGRALIILTLGGKELAILGQLSDEGVRSQASKLLPPPLVRLIDSVVPFESLDDAAIRQVIRAKIEAFHRTVRARKVIFRIHESVYHAAMGEGAKSEMGAGGVCAALDRILFDPITRQLATSNVPERSIIAVTVDEGDGVIQIVTPDMQ